MNNIWNNIVCVGRVGVEVCVRQRESNIKNEFVLQITLLQQTYLSKGGHLVARVLLFSCSECVNFFSQILFYKYNYHQSVHEAGVVCHSVLTKRTCKCLDKCMSEASTHEIMILKPELISSLPSFYLLWLCWLSESGTGLLECRCFRMSVTC